jgi:phosphatidylglycerophosphatase A
LTVPAKPRLAWYHPAGLLATWFGSGLLPKAPGTWGSLAALPCAWVIALMGGPWLLFVASLAVFLLGLWASGHYARSLGQDDPGSVVIDEVAGQWLALLPVALQLEYYPLAFIAFRFFDIVKPWPVNWLDQRLKGALGIMADDMMAGLYAAALTTAVGTVFGTLW